MEKKTENKKDHFFTEELIKALNCLDFFKDLYTRVDQ